jgi:methyl-accepting chemotaxis protein
MTKTSLTTKINQKIILYTVILMLFAGLFSFYQLKQTEKSAYSQISQSLVSLVNAKQLAKGQTSMVGAIALANNPAIKKALITNNRDIALKELSNLSKSYKNGTPFKNVKVHVHTKDIHSFVRAWKPNKFGDDLSSFRNTIIKTKTDKKPFYAIEVGRAGLVMRGLSPIFYGNSYIGSIEFIQGLNSVVKSLKKENIDLLVLMDEKFKSGNALTAENKIKNYYISQKVVDQDYKNSTMNIDFKNIAKQSYLIQNDRLYVSTPIKDISGNIVGIYLISKHLEDINSSLEYTKNLVYIMSIVNVLMVALILIIMSVMLKSVLNKELTRFNNSLDHFLDFISFNVNSFKPTKVTSHDELGLLIEKLNLMAIKEDEKLKIDMKVMGEVVLITDQVAQGIYGCRVKTTAINPMIQTLALTINKMMDTINRDMSQLKSTLECYANNDFRPLVTIDKSLKIDMLAVMNSINILGDKLSQNAQLNLTNGETLTENAVKMSNSILNVSSKANEQASSLEETAAAVDEITSITRNNAQNAIIMAKLGEEVKNAAQAGHKLANETALSMESISLEVNSINNAISVIDQISFQTNILSLNAAVEAATAGEAGKGFAVVAQEVRSLANRSAEAANEIKALVEKATIKASQGKDISDNMIMGYEKLNNHINETIEIINNVSSASKEQMTGIEQINDAITVLDRVTQENANEASIVASISSEVKTIANDLVIDAKSKQFNIKGQ